MTARFWISSSNTSRNSTCMSRTITPPSCATASPIRWTRKSFARDSSRRPSASGWRDELFIWQLLPHLADVGPGVVLEVLFQIEDGEFGGALGAAEIFPR